MRPSSSFTQNQLSELQMPPMSWHERQAMEMLQAQIAESAIRDALIRQHTSIPFPLHSFYLIPFTLPASFDNYVSPLAPVGAHHETIHGLPVHAAELAKMIPFKVRTEDGVDGTYSTGFPHD
ncbi:hypothetical protein FALBO_3227 [Fusarium albosuccineum]|uniref:Uncharacterized protein n=1 Tax=Fusarium albosuccineum TaxID=1237068 RepID=A0A8H4LL66_9HYPO|nr:hypothetical protein FALBO_3227 [Fusarium albosuccineum]